MTIDWKRYAVTAGDLRAQLSAVPDDTPVIIQKDAEGNGYSPLSSVLASCYVYAPDPESTWSGYVHDVRDEDYEPDPDDTPVVLLGPVN